MSASGTQTRPGSAPGSGLSSPPNRAQRIRATLLIGSVLVGYGALGGRLYDIQVAQHERYSDLARKQQHRVRAIAPWRGEILANEDGRPTVLAGSIARGSLFVEAVTDKDVERAERANAAISAEDFLARLELALPLSDAERTYVSEHLERNTAFFLRRRKLEAEDMERLRAVRLDRSGYHVQVIEEPVRGYPFGSLAIQLLGLVATVESKVAAPRPPVVAPPPPRSSSSKKHHAAAKVAPAPSPAPTPAGEKVEQPLVSFQGQCGLEKAFEEQLRGVRGLREVELDNAKRELIDPSSIDVEARPGLSVLTTIDRRIQAIVEEEIEKTCAEWNPKGVACVVVDPYTGNVLAIATRPTFQPDDLGHAKPEAFRNRALCGHVRAGLDDQGAHRRDGVGSGPRLAHARDLLPEGLSPPRAVRTRSPTRTRWARRTRPASSSTRRMSGAVQIGARLGMLKIRRALETFGLGHRTGIELPAEVAGDVRNLAKTDLTTLGTVCQGYGFNVTPLQMALAYAAIANGGTLFRPRVVAELRSPEGETLRKFEPVPVARVLSAHTAKDLLAKALERVVSDKEGTAHACQVPGYTLAGKTGTQLPRDRRPLLQDRGERELLRLRSGGEPEDRLLRRGLSAVQAGSSLLGRHRRGSRGLGDRRQDAQVSRRPAERDAGGDPEGAGDEARAGDPEGAGAGGQGGARPGGRVINAPRCRPRGPRAREPRRAASTRRSTS